MIARYLTWRYCGFTHEQARALADADMVVLGWVEVSRG